MEIICWIKTLIRSFTIQTIITGAYISGHDFIEQEDGSLICKVCGKIDK